MTTHPNLLTTAIQHHQSGRLSEAEHGYRQILQLDPDQPDALHLLGVIAHQVGKHEIAIELIGRSIQINGNEAHVHNNLGGAYRAIGRIPDAVDSYRRALVLRPDYIEALVNLGNATKEMNLLDEAIASYRRLVELQPSNPEMRIALGTLLKEQGKFDEAITAYSQVSQMKWDSAEGHVNLGNAFNELGRSDEAVSHYRRAIELSPCLEIGHLNLGVVLKEQGQKDEAISCYHRALQLNPNFAEAHNNLGITFCDQGQLDEAIDCFLRSLEINPNYADAHNNLGIALSKQGKREQAVACYRAALESNPRFANAYNNLGITLKDQGKLDEAVDCFQRALELKPNDSDVYCNLAVAMKNLGRLDEAAACCHQALSLNPNDPDAHNHLGNVMKDQGNLEAAIDCYRRAMELSPQCVDAHSNFVYTRLFCPGNDGESLFKEHSDWNLQHAEPLSRNIQPHRNDRTADRRLRIGYVSPDFRNHVIGRNLIPLFQEHDHQQFEIRCYADVPSADELTKRFQSHADIWRETSSLSDEQLADVIRNDRIDILVDLTLHLAQNRLLVFARKPAPLQVTFAGYPGTTGLTTIDYRLTDAYLDPPDLNDRYYSEESFRLAHSFWCYDPLGAELPVNALPAAMNGTIVYGCLNNFCKVNDCVLRLWAQVLKSVDQSRLIVLAGGGTHRERTLNVLSDEGIDRERVTFVANRPRQQYLKYYHEIDISLDTVPYGGHSTSLDSFWMGVPVVTLVGQTVTGRAGFSQLKNLDLPELIAETEDQFVNIATELAQDLPRLSVLRATLRDRMQASPLMDTVGFARSIEAAYIEIWKRWCSEVH